MIGREADGPLWPVMAVLEAHADGLGPLSASGFGLESLSRPMWTGLGCLGPLWMILGRSRVLSDLSRDAFGRKQMVLGGD